MSRNNLKRYLMLLAVIGLVAIAGGGGSGTFATFNAQVTNTGNYFSTGTLFLHDTPNGGTTCTSESDTTNNQGTGCTWLFNSDLLTGPFTATLALNNAGTINASDISFDVNGCSVGNNSVVTGSSVVFGSAPTCSNMYMTIQETGSTYAVPSTDVACAYGPTTTPPACDTPNNTATLAGPTSLTNLLTTGAATATLAAGATRYYVITIAPTVASGNTLQNRKVSFGMTWHLDQ